MQPNLGRSSAMAAEERTWLWQLSAYELLLCCFVKTTLTARTTLKETRPKAFFDVTLREYNLVDEAGSKIIAKNPESV